jgi:hypothetical protein
MSTAEQAALLNRIREAMATDPRGWWTGDEVDEFLGAWSANGLPELKLQDAEGEYLVIWTTDLERAGEMLGLPVGTDVPAQIEIRQGAYVVCIAQAKR